MACFFCKHFEGNKNHDDSIAGRCGKFYTYIEERIAHEDCSFYEDDMLNRVLKPVICKRKYGR